MRRILYALSMVLTASMITAAPAFAAQFDSWVALVVAGDFRAHSSAPSEVFDNGRRDIAKALRSLGFTQSRILQFSVKPDSDKETNPKLSDVTAIRSEFLRLARQSSGGCFIYFTSHGGPQGILVNDAILAPREMAQMVNEGCADRATVVFVSACFSGVFIPALKADTHMVMSAARPDRTSFGCGETNKYTFFDQCVLESIPAAPNFPRLATRVQDCVAAREKAEGVDMPSEPQVSIGTTVQNLLGQYAFSAR